MGVAANTADITRHGGMQRLQHAAQPARAARGAYFVLLRGYFDSTFLAERLAIRPLRAG